MLTVSMVRTLKGTPLAVFILLRMAQEDGIGPQGAEWLERYSGYTDKPVSQALLFLEEQGLISRNGRYLWQLAGEVRQLPLSVPDLDEAKNRVGENPTQDSSSSSRFKPLSKVETTIQESENFRLNLSALDSAGIREPKRTHLAGLAHVTPGLVAGHVRECKGSTGLAIYRIENNWPLEETVVIDVPVQRQEAQQEEVEEADEIVDSAWAAVVGQLAQECGRAMFETWIKPARLIEVKEGVWTVDCQNDYARDLLEARIGSLAGRLLTGYCGFPARVEFVLHGRRKE